MLKDFVSGIPGDGEPIKTGIRAFRAPERIHLKNEPGKSAYHSGARSLSKKITLAKEEKKEKSH